MDTPKDISSILISEHSIQHLLPSILLDAIVLSENFKIIAASQNVLDYLGFTVEELKNQSVNFLAGDQDIRAMLTTNLAAGYFSDKRARLLTKGKQWISVSITGFYLGLISDFNGSVILKIKNLDEVDLINKKLLLKKAELEEFIYRTSHDLRGPLATIRGLVNLIRLRKDNEELESLIHLMAERTEKLDERLSQLLYLSQAAQEVSKPNYIVDFSAIESEIKKIADQNAIPSFVKLNFDAPVAALHGLNEIHTKLLITNLFQHLLSLPMIRLDSSISISIELNRDSLDISIESAGFVLSDSLTEALSRSEFIYSEILSYPQLVHYYTAQKIASGFLSQIQFDLICPDCHRLSVSIPLKHNLNKEKKEVQELDSFG